MKKTNATLAIQVLPQTSNNNDEEVVRIVDEVIAYLKSTGLEVFVGPLETTIEGDFDKLMEIATNAQKICVEQGAFQVNTYMKMFYNPDNGVLSIEQKTKKHHQ